MKYFFYFSNFSIQVHISLIFHAIDDLHAKHSQTNYAGLSYINKKRLLKHNIFLIRPLLIFSREDTKKFCQLQNIPIWEDPTNCDLTIKRNIVRKEIIPILETMYPGCSKRINSFAEKMSNYKNEQNDLSKLASLYCEDAIGVKRELLNSLCIEARCTCLLYTSPSPRD